MAVFEIELMTNGQWKGFLAQRQRWTCLVEVISWPNMLCYVYYTDERVVDSGSDAGTRAEDFHRVPSSGPAIQHFTLRQHEDIGVHME